MDTREIFLKHVCPGVGCGIALIMFGSPLPAIRAVNKNKNLGELNALPFAAMTINCASWVFYALLLTDYYIYFGNLPGMLFGMYYVLTCYKFSKEAAQDMLCNIFLGGVFLFWLMGLISIAGSLNASATKTLWGATSVAVLGVYYVAPLSSVAKVVAERDSSSLHWPLCMMNIINGMLWFAYGLALRDWFIALPNGIGAGFNVLCLIMCFLYPAKRRRLQEQQRRQSQQQGHPVLDQINPAANWDALRLQSFARPAGQFPGGVEAGGAAGGGGGFFDLTQMRWRPGNVAGSFRNSSFVRMLSRSQSSSTAMHGDAVAMPSGVVGGGMGDIAEKGGVLDQGVGVKGGVEGVGEIKAGGDVEQARVVADATLAGLEQQRQQQP